MTIRQLTNFLNRKYGIDKETLNDYRGDIKGLNYDDVCVGMKEETNWENNSVKALNNVIDNLEHDEKYYRRR